jgi:hypothetical protein
MHHYLHIRHTSFVLGHFPLPGANPGTVRPTIGILTAAAAQFPTFNNVGANGVPLSAAEIAAAAANAAIAAAAAGKDSGPARQARRLYVGNIPPGTNDVKFVCLSSVQSFEILIYSQYFLTLTIFSKKRRNCNPFSMIVCVL